MSNTGFSGIDERQNGTPLLIDASLKDSTGALITSGVTLLSLVEVQSDGTFLSYDFFDNTFKAGALTTPTVAMTHQKSNNGTTNTGIWNYVLSTIAGFTVGANYRQIVTNSGASPAQQERAWQFAGGPNDKALSLLAATVIRTGTAQAGAASTITLDSGASATDNVYVPSFISITAGTGAGQIRAVSSYVGSTKVATITPAWTTNPDNTSVFYVLPQGAVTLASDQVPLKKNTALNGYEFVMVSATDGRTPLPGLTVSGFVSLDGVDFVALTNAPSGVSGGVYKVNLAAADTNANVLTFKFTATGADPTLISHLTQ